MHQVAALPYRYTDASGEQIEVLLITSSAGRWIIPKGDVDGGLEPHLAAEKEAFEEGGVQGRIDPRTLGAFSFCKEQDGAAVSVKVDVFPLEVAEQLDRWPEMRQRDRRWLPVDEAARAVEEPDLQAIISSFRP